MNIFKLCGIVLTCLASVLVLRQYKKEYALLIVLAATVAIGIYAAAGISPAVVYLSSVLNGTSISSYTGVMLKATGVAITVQTASEMCRDVGESSLGAKLELAGKVEILLLCIPLLREIFGLLGEVR